VHSLSKSRQFQVERVLELVRGGLCGLVTPVTPRSNNYFLLLVDDCCRYMWLAMIPSKNCAAAAIQSIQAQAEAEAGMKYALCGLIGEGHSIQHNL
jgi:hypothetical protein